ncbi:acyl-CoA carboxylase epsilon subunit [Streptomyces sp. NBC_01216]|uniref:acyl-CoA carboxylase epsilon subunit n=1 Tax=unclassified Streptomyces TaxID=2593676 RepID=UPI002E1687B2|nr:acyl-CoA carboxylase subunit epsilon [Streptomyces sp. NBC_01216]
MSGDVIRVLRGAPTPEELAACVLVLQTLVARRGGAGPGDGGGPSAAGWPRAAEPLAVPAPSWSSRRPPAWRGA